MDILVIIIAALFVALLGILLFLPLRFKNSLTQALAQAEENNRSQALMWQNTFRQELFAQLSLLKQELGQHIQQTRQAGVEQARDDRRELRHMLEALSSAQNQRLGEVRGELEKAAAGIAQGLEKMRAENSGKLEEMRQTVDEKLANTLEKRLGDSFMQVSRQLEMVHKSVGEMQGLAVGVGDLKKLLSNVKTRGTWGEVQLAGILEDIFTSEQIACNVEIRPGSNERVEFALRMPGNEREALLPLDAKFPREDYERLLEAAELGDKQAEESALKALEQSIRKAARDISEKYIYPPFSTDLAIMFLPTEGLYAEVLKRPGLMESLQREYKVVPVGPSNLGVLLNCFQVGFRTLAIEKKSSEIWKILGAVKTEFGKYGLMMDKLRKKLNEAENVLNDVDTRYRAVNRRLRQAENLPQEEAGAILGLLEPLEELEDEVNI